MVWTERYKPEKLEDVIGHHSAVDLVSEWADNWASGKKQKPLLLHGATGVGKTCIATALANERDWDLLEMNASDLRNKANIERIAGLASVSQTLTGRKRLILLDEIDGLLGRQDRGGPGAVANILKGAACPIILTANDAWDKKLSTLRAHCRAIEMKKVHQSSIAKLLEKIAKQENVEVQKEALLKIAKNAHGDIRCAINDLQMLAQGSKKLSFEETEILGVRDKEENIFNAVRIILKSTDFYESKDVMMNLKENPDFILKWIVENVPVEYKDPQDLHNAFEALSRADIFLGRTSRRQSYALWRYATVLMSAGVALSKKEPYHGFSRYAFPSSIRYMARTRSKRAMRKQIALKIGRQCHTSWRTAVQDYLPMFRELVRDKEKAAGLAQQFDFDEDEIKFLKK